MSGVRYGPSMGRVMRPYDRGSLMALTRRAPVDMAEERAMRETWADTEKEYWDTLIKEKVDYDEAVEEWEEAEDDRLRAPVHWLPPPLYTRKTKKSKGGGAAPTAAAAKSKTTLDDEILAAATRLVGQEMGKEDMDDVFSLITHYESFTSHGVDYDILPWAKTHREVHALAGEAARVIAPVLIFQILRKRDATNAQLSEGLAPFLTEETRDGLSAASVEDQEEARAVLDQQMVTQRDRAAQAHGTFLARAKQLMTQETLMAQGGTIVPLFDLALLEEPPQWNGELDASPWLSKDYLDAIAALRATPLRYLPLDISYLGRDILRANLALTYEADSAERKAVDLIPLYKSPIAQSAQEWALRKHLYAMVITLWKLGDEGRLSAEKVAEMSAAEFNTYRVAVANLGVKT
jgi:hypothetical protein